MLEFIKNMIGRPKIREVTNSEEVGSTGTDIVSGYLTEDYNAKLQFPGAAKVYDEMRKSDATVASTLRAVKQPIQSAHFYIEPASDDPKDIEVAEFIEWQLFEKLCFQSNFLPQALLYFDFGFMLFEKCYRYEKNGPYPGKVCLYKLAPRLPKSVDKWVEISEYSEVGVEQSGYRDEKYINANIPAWKLVRFTLDQEGNNYEGVSMLRPAYKHWRMKSAFEKIGAIAAERTSIGIPTLFRTEQGGTISEEEKKQNKAILRQIKANKEAFLDLGYGNDFKFSTSQGGFDFQPLLRYHDRQISKAVLAQFLETGSEGSKGGYAQNKADQQLFFKSIESHVSYLCHRLNDLIIKELVLLNYDVEALPKLKYKDIEPKDNNVFSIAMERFVKSGVLSVDLEVENLVRERVGVPKIDEETFEEIRQAKQVVKEIESVKKEGKENNSSEATNFPSQGDNKEISLRNSQYNQFDHAFAKRIKEQYPSVWKKGGNIRGNEAYNFWTKARSGEKTDGVKKWIKEREAWAARHKGNFRIAGVVAAMKWGVVVSRGESYMKKLINESVDKVKKKSKLSDGPEVSRPLTLAEEKIDLEKFRKNMNDSEESISRTASTFASVVAADVKRRSGEYFDTNKFPKKSDLVKESEKIAKKDLTKKQLDQYEFGKTEAIRELGQDGRIGTDKEVRDSARESSKLYVESVEADMEKEAKSTILSSRQKGVSKKVALEAVVSALAVIKVRQSGLFASLSSTGMINRGIADVHSRYKNLIWGEQYSAILDERTSNICLSLDGRVETGVGKLPQPPLHANCRSRIVSILKTQDPKPKVNKPPKSVVENISPNPFKTRQPKNPTNTKGPAKDEIEKRKN